MKVHILPVLKDNYIYLLHDPDSHRAIVIDPAIASPVLAKLAELKADLIAILNTHHHADHIGGNPQLLAKFPHLKIYGGALDQGRIPHQHFFLKDGDRLDFDFATALVLAVPGHTKAHLAYYFASGDLFCGDTLFGAGCGRLFEGTPAQMLISLTKLATLPDATRVWAAHEYTRSNLQFALSVMPDNHHIQTRLSQVQHPTMPSTIALEKQTNLFLQCDRPELQNLLGHSDPVRVFAKLRGMKDLF